MIGEFTANEVLFPARTTGEIEAFTFDQSDLYTVNQPAIFLVDGFSEVYVWLGWWPRQDNQLLREANATTGSSHTNWLRDKKLACETAQHYIKGMYNLFGPVYLGGIGVALGQITTHVFPPLACHGLIAL